MVLPQTLAQRETSVPAALPLCWQRGVCDFKGLGPGVTRAAPGLAVGSLGDLSRTDWLRDKSSADRMFFRFQSSVGLAVNPARAYLWGWKTGRNVMAASVLSGSSCLSP